MTAEIKITAALRRQIIYEEMAKRGAKGGSVTSPEKARAARRNGKLNEGKANAKLTDDNVKVIKRRLAKGDKQTAIAEDFNVSRFTINRIANGSRWKD